jgi:predicted site-specific integrase-resolvase
MTNTISRKDVAQLLHCSVGTVRRLEKAGTLRPIRISAPMVRFVREEIERLLAEAGKEVSAR